MPQADPSRTRLLQLLDQELDYHPDEGFHSGPRASVFDLTLRAEREPAARAYARVHKARWPATETSWRKHLTELCEKIGGDIAASKLRTVAKRLRIEQQTMTPYNFTLRYNRFIPDLDWRGGLTDDRLAQLPAILSNLTGQGHRNPARLFTFEEVQQEFHLTNAELWELVRRFGLDPIKVGHQKFRLHLHDVLWLRELEAEFADQQP